jgi:CBS domain-containing protein
MSTHVVTERGRVVGIVTITDLLELFGRGSDRRVVNGPATHSTGEQP